MFTELLNSWADVHARHAMLVHIPIALGALGVLPLLVLAGTRFTSRPLKVLCVGWFLVGAAAAGLAANAGGQAEETVAKLAAVHDHEEAGENGWIWMLGAAGLSALTLLPQRKAVVAAGMLAIAGALGVGGWAVYTGHTGGKLVYTHGLGVPAPGATPAVRERHGDGN